jgi:hypothetical protein
MIYTEVVCGNVVDGVAVVDIAEVNVVAVGYV